MHWLYCFDEVCMHGHDDETDSVVWVGDTFWGLTILRSLVTFCIACLQLSTASCWDLLWACLGFLCSEISFAVKSSMSPLLCLTLQRSLRGKCSSTSPSWHLPPLNFLLIMAPIGCACLVSDMVVGPAFLLLTGALLGCLVLAPLELLWRVCQALIGHPWGVVQVLGLNHPVGCRCHHLGGVLSTGAAWWRWCHVDSVLVHWCSWGRIPLSWMFWCHVVCGWYAALAVPVVFWCFVDEEALSSFVIPWSLVHMSVMYLGSCNWHWMLHEVMVPV